MEDNHKETASNRTLDMKEVEKLRDQFLPRLFLAFEGEDVFVELEVAALLATVGGGGVGAGAMAG